jgi:hypothetical protein
LIYCDGKFAYVKNHANSKFGARVYGPSSKPRKIRV